MASNKMSTGASAGSLCYECSSKVADCWCNDCKCDMCEECYTKLHQGRKLSQHQQMPIEQKPESCEDHLCKKRKNDTSVLINNSVNDINKDEQLAEAQKCLKEKTDKANGLVADNDNVNIRQITRTFKKLRKMINEREETLKTQVRAIEKKNEALSSKTALKPPTKIDYCIDGVDQLETKITDLLNQACVTEFAAPSTYVQPNCKGRSCVNCGKCRDWYYNGDLETWRWIISVKNWDEAERKRWDDGKYLERFKKRNGSTCRAYYGYYHDRSHKYHGPHIYFDCTYFCRGGCSIPIDYGGTCFACGNSSRAVFDYDVYPYCQCLENIKEK